MAGLNRATLIGHLGKDVEIRRTQDGRPIANFSIATSESWRDKTSGERKEKVEWHNIVIFNEGLAGLAEKYLSKGSKVYIEGKIQTRKWQDQSGADRWSTEIVLAFDAKLIFLDPKSKDGRPEARPQEQVGYAGDPALPAGEEERSLGGGDVSDGIPFGPF